MTGGGDFFLATTHSIGKRALFLSHDLGDQILLVQGIFVLLAAVTLVRKDFGLFRKLQRLNQGNQHVAIKDIGGSYLDCLHQTMRFVHFYVQRS